MIAVIFEVWAAPGRKDDYLGLAASLRRDLEAIDGFISVERFQSLTDPDKLLSLPIHQLALVVHGVYLLENLTLEELASKGVNEFALIMQPLKLEGATGSTVAPVAVY